VTGSDLVLSDVRDGVATLTLHAPERRNAWSLEMEHRYFELLDGAAADDDVRAIVLTGAGTSFCPGLDTSRLAAGAAGGGLQLAGRRSQHFALTVPKPMIAAINGACAGIGLVQALVCDVRFVSKGARLSTAYARRGLPAEYGMSWLLPRLIGTERALDLLLSARTFTGEEAVALGVASRLCEPDDVLPAAVAYAQELARFCSPRSMAVIRRQVWGDLSRDYSDANAVWLDAMRHGNVDNPDFVEGVESFVERREPRFAPLPADLLLPELPLFHSQGPTAEGAT
jgi:enoyl-CoA hydratase/carnithine racemase